MTIGLQAKGNNGFLQIETNTTDLIDTGGFSDSINTVGAKSAKFSSGGIMKANVGLKIGLVQLKINAGFPVNRVEVAADFVSWPANGSMVDNNETTSVTSVSNTATAVIDYGFVDIRDIKLVTRMTGLNQVFSSTDMSMFYEISNDNITYTDPVASPSLFNFLDFPNGTSFARDTGIVTYNDPNLQSFRYIRITVQSIGGTPLPVWFIYQVTEQSIGSSQVTVRVRSSVSLDGIDGSVIVPDQVMSELNTLVFDTELLLTGQGQYITLQIVSFSNFPMPVNLQEITSIQEV